MENSKRLTFVLLSVFLVALALSLPQVAQGAATSKSLRRASVIAQPSDAWWNPNWQYRKQQTILGSAAGAQTNYPVLIVVHRTEGTDKGNDVYVGGKCQPDFDDIRFTTDGPSPTELDYWIEDANYAGNAALVWVEIPSIPASPDTCAIYVYYGNALASGVSSGDNTFIFFDDFEDGVVDSSKWLEHNMDLGASFSESGGKLRLTDTTTEVDPWGLFQGLMARSGGVDWNPPENAFKITLEGVHWNSTDPNENLPQGNWGVSLSGSKNAGDLVDGDLSIFMQDAWIATKGQIHSSEDDQQHSFDSNFVSHQATCDFLIYKNYDATVDTFYNQTPALINESQTNPLSYLVIVYSGHGYLNYQDLTIDTFIFQKWVDPEPTVKSEDTTNPIWTQAPTNQVLAFGQSLNYQVSATDPAGIARWTINDTTHFAINNGRITNITALLPGRYALLITAYDPSDNYCAAMFTVTVQAPTTPTTPPIPGFPFASIGAGLILASLFTVLAKRQSRGRRKPQ